jgi:hypothetical protein
MLLPMYLKEMRIFFSGRKEYFRNFLLIWPNWSKLYTRIVIFLTFHDAITALPSCKVVAPRPCKKEGVDCCSTLDVEPRSKSVNLSSLFMSDALNPLTFRVSKVCPISCEANGGLELEKVLYKEKLWVLGQVCSSFIIELIEQEIGRLPCFYKSILYILILSAYARRSLLPVFLSQEHVVFA